jgi:hypothetical protein
MTSDFLDSVRLDSPAVGIVGYRSWIAGHLQRELHDRGFASVMYDKDVVEKQDFSWLECLYVFPGRSRPTTEEMERERTLIAALCEMRNSRQPRRTVFLGSCAPVLTSYGAHKSLVEEMVHEYCRRGATAADWGWTSETIVLRAPAVFGPGQPEGVDMLIPMLSASDGQLELRSPDLLTQFIYVGDLVRHMAMFADRGYWDQNRSGQPGSFCVLPGTMSMTPQQLKNLYNTWRSYR